MKLSNSVLVFGLSILISISCAKSEKEQYSAKDSSLALLNPTPKKLKVAFIGDSGHEKNFKKVLKLIKEENVDLVLHLGDLGYDESNSGAPEKWNSRINDVLGEKFPYLFLIGNHDAGHWYQTGALSYASILKKRIADNPEIVCVGEEGIKSYCSYRGLFFVISGIGSYGNRHEEFIGHALNKAKDYSWRICAWHKNQRDMQVGTKSDEVGWPAYQLCQSHGAMIATAHEHSYARTMNLSKIGNRKENHGAFGDPNALVLARGKTFSFVSGLGGASLRNINCEKRNNKWWASVFAGNYLMQNAKIQYDECDDAKSQTAERVEPGGPTNYNYGALFVTFYHNNDPRLAKGELKTIDGRVIDEFTIKTSL